MSRTTILAVGGLAAIVIAVAFMLGPAGRSVPSDAVYPADLADQRRAAVAAQREERLDDAVRLWSQLANELADRDAAASFRYEALENARLCRPRDRAEIGRTYEVTPTDSPHPLTRDDFINACPAGRTIRSLAIGDATGRGTNQAWGLATAQHYYYSAESCVETRILDNDGRRVRAEVRIKNLTQDLAFSNKRLRVAPIDSPILVAVWEAYKPIVLLTPHLSALARIPAAVDAVDPGGERVLTQFYRRLKEVGVDLAPDKEVQLRQRIDELQGSAIELTIERESGIRHVKLAAGSRWATTDDLRAFARNSGLLADFAFSRLLALKPGESGSVAATDLVRLIGLRYDVDVAGMLEFRRSDEQDDAPFVHFEAIGGEVRVSAEVEGEQRRGVLRPIQGRVTFDRERMLIARADGQWHTDVDWATQDHLLFGTKGMRDVDVQSHYEADMQDKAAKDSRIENSQ